MTSSFPEIRPADSARQPSWVRIALILVGYALLYLWSLYFYMGSEGHVVVWLSFGFLAGWLIRLDFGSWIPLVLGAMAVEVAFTMAVVPLPVGLLAFYAFIHVAMAAIAAVLYLTMSGSRDGFVTSRDVWIFLVAAVLAAPLGGALLEHAMEIRRSAGTRPEFHVLVDFASLANGIIYVAPPVLYWGRLRDMARSAYASRPWWHHALAVSIPVWIVLASGKALGDSTLPFWLYIFSGLLAILISTGMMGMWGTLSSASAVAFVGAHQARISSGLLESLTSGSATVLLSQIGLMGAGVLASYLVASRLHDLAQQRARIQAELQKHEDFFTTVPVGLWELDQRHTKVWLDAQGFPRPDACRPFLSENVDELRRLIGASSFRANPEVARLYGFPTLDDLMEHHQQLFLSSPDSLLIDVWSRLYAGESDVQLEFERVQATGSTMEIRIQYRIPHGSRKDWTRWIVAVTDITDHRQKETRISQLNEEAQVLSRLLLETERIARIGSWYLDARTGDISWSPGMYAINALPEDTELTLASSLSRVHPADKEWLARTFEQGVTDHRTRFRLLLPDGQVRWVESFGVEDHDDEGELVGLRGFQVDITDQMHFEEEKGGVADILETTAVVAYVAEQSDRGRLRYISPGIGQYGWVREDLLQGATDLFSYIPADHAARLSEQIQSLRPEMGHVPLEYPLHTPVGTIWYRDFVRRRHTGPDRAPVYEGVLIDITAEKEATALRDLEQRRRDALTTLPGLQEGKSEQEFIQDALEMAESLTSSRISFLHFMNNDETVELVAWSRRTMESYCQAGYDKHYPISQAGIWAQAYRTRQAVIVNDYATAENKKGLPEGHAGLDRFISLPVLDEDRTVVLAGVGNADRPYTEEDVLSMQIIFNEVWRLVGGARRRRLLEDEKTRLRTFFDATYDSFVIYENTGDGETFLIKYLNKAAEEIGGVAEADALGRDFRDVWPGVKSSGVYDIVRKVWETGEPHTERELHYVYDRVDQWHDVSAARLPDGTVAVAYRDVSTTVRSRSDAMRLEKELAASQRMEALGRLAGGVAHDFNNLLGVIIGHAEAGQYASDDPATLKQHLAHIEDAAMRSAKMTKQLLGFARRQVGQFSHLDLAEHLATLMSMLRRLIGENVQLSYELPDQPVMIDVDPTFVDQIITNLCVNARDAMTGPGKLLIQLEPVQKTAVDTIWPEECVLDEYLCIRVTDTGHGIDPAILPNIFEPFFSTRETGTGLGLSTVFGIVRQLSGHIDIQSEVGKGTTVRVFLPPAPEQGTAA